MLGGFVPFQVATTEEELLRQREIARAVLAAQAAQRAVGTNPAIARAGDFRTGQPGPRTSPYQNPALTGTTLPASPSVQRAVDRVSSIPGPNVGATAGGDLDRPGTIDAYNDYLRDRGLVGATADAGSAAGRAVGGLFAGAASNVASQFKRPGSDGAPVSGGGGFNLGAFGSLPQVAPGPETAADVAFGSNRSTGATRDVSNADRIAREAGVVGGAAGRSLNEGTFEGRNDRLAARLSEASPATFIDTVGPDGQTVPITPGSAYSLNGDGTVSPLPGDGGTGGGGDFGVNDAVNDIVSELDARAGSVEEQRAAVIAGAQRKASAYQQVLDQFNGQYEGAVGSVGSSPYASVLGQRREQLGDGGIPGLDALDARNARRVGAQAGIANTDLGRRNELNRTIGETSSALVPFEVQEVLDEVNRVANEAQQDLADNRNEVITEAVTTAGGETLTAEEFEKAAKGTGRGVGYAGILLEGSANDQFAANAAARIATGNLTYNELRDEILSAFEGNSREGNRILSQVRDVLGLKDNGLPESDTFDLGLLTPTQQAVLVRALELDARYDATVNAGKDEDDPTQQRLNAAVFETWKTYAASDDPERRGLAQVAADVLTLKIDDSASAIEDRLEELNPIITDQELNRARELVQRLLKSEKWEFDAFDETSIAILEGYDWQTQGSERARVGARASGTLGDDQ